MRRRSASAILIVENRPGAASNIATEAVGRAPADGYTLRNSVVARLSSMVWLIPPVPYSAFIPALFSFYAGRLTGTMLSTSVNRLLRFDFSI